MLKATLKSLMAHKLRLILTAVAVVLGVAFMAGTFVLTDTIKHNINAVIAQTSVGKNVIVRGTAQFKSSGPGSNQDSLAGNDRPLVPENLLSTIRSVPGVGLADGQVLGLISIVGSDGKSVSGGHAGAPTLALAWVPDRALTTLVLRSGREPQKDDEMVIDKKTATSAHLTVGDTISVTGHEAPQPFTIVGIVGFGTQDTLAGATLTAFNTATAQKLAGHAGSFNEIDVAATPGTGTEKLVTAVGAVLPENYEAISAAAALAETAANFDSFVNIINKALLAFAFIALFVGAFLIFNTFSILVGQRTRELALLRAVGAGRAQVVSSVLGEAALTGLLGSLVGLGLGYLLADGLYHLLKSFLSLSNVNLQLLSRTIIVSLVAGTLITLVSALAPAIRASRVPPVAAMRDDFVVAETSLRRRAIAGGSVLVAGIVGLVFGLVNKSLPLAGAGAAGTFIGVAMLVPLVASPLARIIGSPLPVIQGVTGRLGRENSARNPRRTAATASALMIGIAVVAAVSTLAHTALASFTGTFDKSFQASYVIIPSNSFVFPAAAAEAAVKAAPGVTAMSGFSLLAWHAKGATKQVDGVDPVQGPQVFRIDMAQGPITALGEGKLLVDETTARNDHITIGDTIDMTFATTGTKTLTVGGIYKDNAILSEHYLASNEIIAANSNTVQDVVILVKTALITPAAQEALKKAVAGFTNLKVRTAEQFKADRQGQLTGFLRLVNGLLALSIVIAGFGVINTLFLSVLERTREIGLLRSVGMFRRQVRRMINGEAIVVSLLGAVLGLVVGIALGAALVSTVIGNGTNATQIVIPVRLIIVVLVAAGVFGVVAALIPAHRAAKLDVLEAISTV